ncbi:MAG TPA: hypothetical protein PKK12_13155 [Candidatus Aminicenantes bacterium]|mgnify:CR=1 FL=1|nr:hypothetical protein [Candidatus Aminicenantes bacterium]
MNHLLVGFEYSDDRFLMPAEGDVGTVLEALMRCELVHVEGYGESAKLSPAKRKLEMLVLTPGDPRLQSKDMAEKNPDFAAALNALEAARNEANAATYKAESRANEIQKKLDAVLAQVATAHLNVHTQTEPEPTSESF